MKICPKCKFENSDEEIKCKKCLHEFSKSEQSPGDKKNVESEEWPSSEWKDWNLM